jgi:DNA-binding transcriptional MerR regulator
MSEMTSTRCHIPLRIGELAGELGLNPKTIRYYEEIGLLPAPRRSDAGYRLYGAADRERLRFIAKAKAIGFTLREIGEILALRDGGTEPCPHVGKLLDRKLALVDAQLRLLGELRADLQLLKAETAVTACSSTPICGLIELHEPTRR